jgi:Spy/CpxP family protein refolding chaperone
MPSRTRAAFLLVGVFLLGGVAGAALHHIYLNHIASVQQARPRVPNSHDITEEMAQSLKLDAQQTEQLRVIIQQSREHYGALSKQFRPQYEIIREDTNAAIRKILHPDQLQQFEDTLKRMDMRHQARPHEPPPPPSQVAK